MNGWRRLANFLALRRNTFVILGALILMGTGEKLWIGFVPKYLEVLGAGIFIIGLFDALQTLLGAVYAYPGGWLTDHWGQRRSLLFFNALSVAGYIIVLAWCGRNSARSTAVMVSSVVSNAQCVRRRGTPAAESGTNQVYRNAESGVPVPFLDTTLDTKQSAPTINRY